VEKFRDTLQVRKERAILVAALIKRKEPGDDLVELTALAESAGAIVVDRFQQKISRPHPATYMGRGKAELLSERVKRFQADVVIFDNDLSPAQIRELEKILEVKVLDRSELILDIFATRAKTRQAKLQVELAQLEYTYPRLTRMWSHLDTVTGAAAGAVGSVGGIGTRGAGEKQLEIDRRLVNKRLTELRRELAEIDKRRLREIKGRKDSFKACLVGYTNAGKSTLLNTLTDAGVLTEDRLFATLDTRTRKWTLEKGMEILISDTVGFVGNLPHQLVASFKATLEETIHADLLIHVIDIANARAMEQIASVDQVLRELDCQDKPILMVFNKADSNHSMVQLHTLETIYPDAIAISAKTGMGLAHLQQAIQDRYRGDDLHLRVRHRHVDGRIHSFLRAHGHILHEDYDDSDVFIEVLLGNKQLPGLQRLQPDAIEVVPS
jgi:GTP-binding protein HflX